VYCGRAKLSGIGEGEGYALGVGVGVKLAVGGEKGVAEAVAWGISETKMKGVRSAAGVGNAFGSEHPASKRKTVQQVRLRAEIFIGAVS
jgi:hypothetical protein